MSSGRGRGRLFEFLSQTTSSNQQSSSSGICSSETTGRAESHEHIPSEQRPSASSVPSDSGLSTNSGAAGRRQLHEQTVSVVVSIFFVFNSFVYSTPFV